jgi:membrane protein YqaA with SNARE-associated domain
MGPGALRKLERAKGWMRRWGVWTLLLAWLPVIGDALPVAAGLARTRWELTLALIALGKTARYAVVIGLGSLAGL